MNSRTPLLILLTTALFIGYPALTQEKPEFTFDLKPLGAAPDLFANQGDSKYQMRGAISVFSYPLARGKE